MMDIWQRLAAWHAEFTAYLTDPDCTYRRGLMGDGILQALEGLGLVIEYHDYTGDTLADMRAELVALAGRQPLIIRGRVMAAVDMIDATKEGGTT